jgi:hypothetical protein
MWFSRAKEHPGDRSTVRHPPTSQVQRLAHVLGRLGPPVLEGDDTLRFVVFPVQHTYRVKLYAWPEQDHAILLASIDYRVERDLVLRELALELLEENHALKDAAFVLIPRAENERLIGCRRVLSLAQSSNSELLLAGTHLVEQMRRIVARLYAKGLLPSGPSLPID